MADQQKPSGAGRSAPLSAVDPAPGAGHSSTAGMADPATLAPAAVASAGVPCGLTGTPPAGTGSAADPTVAVHGSGAAPAANAAETAEPKDSDSTDHGDGILTGTGKGTAPADEKKECSPDTGEKTGKEKASGAGKITGDHAAADAPRWKAAVSSALEGLNRFLQALISFAKANRRSSVIIFFTLVPTLCTYLYTALIYDPMYISKTAFTIKASTLEKSAEMSISPMMGTAVNKDLFIVYAYIKSLDLFNELDGEIGLKKHYQHHDPVSSMPGEPTLKDIEDYWDNVTEVKIDSDSEIVTMSVRAYDPAYAKLLADTILSRIDNLVNTMNANALEDSMKLARQEVEKSKARVKAVSDKIRIYRDKHKYIDPSTEAGSTLGLISSLEAEIAKKKAELYEKQGYMHPDSQEIVNLNRRIEALEEQVRELRGKIVSASGTHQGGESQFSVSKSVGEYEDLQLEHTFAQKLLESSLSTLENVRLQSVSKSKYLVRIDEPKVPDESLWPRPFTSASIVLIISFMLILGISLIVTAVMEHMGI